MISIIIPCYNEEKTIGIYLNAMTPVEEKMKTEYNQSIEFIFVNDGSSDKTLEEIKKHPVRYVSFSRNFGKEAAMLAGLKAAKGEYIAVMDVDLQDPPELIPKMYEDLQSGEYDCVATKRTTRKGEPVIRSFFANCFYKMINKISETEIVNGARDYRLMTRKMVNAILQLEECNRFSKGLFSWVGFKTKWIDYKNVERSAGETKWSFWKLFLYSIDGVVAFSVKPLAFASVLGIVMSIVALVMICFVVARTLIFGDPVDGYPSMLCIILLISGLNFLCMGVVGQYLAKLYIEIKKRPIYIVDEEK